MTYSLTDDQKVCLKDDGYIVLKDAVPQTVVDEARNLIPVSYTHMTLPTIYSV